MNVLYYCQLYPPAIFGGGEYIFFQWAKELAKRGHNVTTIAQKLQGTLDFEKIDGINVIRIGTPIKYGGGLPITVKSNFEFLAKSYVKGLSICSNTNIDIIHSNTFVPALSGYACGKTVNKPHIVTFHDVYFLKRDAFWSKWGSEGQSTGLISVMGPLVERVLLHLPGTLYHTVSETSKEDLLCAGVKNVSVIPNGISLDDYYVKETNTDSLTCVYVGRLVFYKNLDTVIKAFRIVVNRLPTAKLVVIGDGPMRPKWAELVTSLGLTKHVLFVGRVSHEEKARLISSSSFLVHPSLVEGFGIVLLEAFACRKPALVSDVKPLTEIVLDNVDGYLIPPFDSTIWAEKMISLFTNNKKAKEMGMKGRLKLEQFYTIPKVVDRLELLYNQLLNGDNS